MERWSIETNTFYMSVVEMTIITRHGHLIWIMYTWSFYHWYYRYQSIYILGEVIGLFLRICFITTNFSYLLPNVLYKVTLQRYIRAYVPLLMDSSLFVDKKETYLQLTILSILRDFAETAQYK